VYFPHVDNVYSHRSTQKYKRKLFISHYWDCRLKGRPPGTPKSDDPTKKKRKRTARERDLCDVKIKITEYFPGAGISENGDELAVTVPDQMLVNPDPASTGRHGAHRGRYFTIQRVNGNGANGKSTGAGGGHRHTLEDSDRVKKSSVQRYLLKEAKNRKSNPVS
jgi:glutathione S-transferase